MGHDQDQTAYLGRVRNQIRFMIQRVFETIVQVAHLDYQNFKIRVNLTYHFSTLEHFPNSRT